MNLRSMEWLLRSHGVLADRLIGITKQDTMIHENERGIQVLTWRTENRHVGPYAALDDLDLGFTEALVPLVQTNSHEGLKVQHVGLLIALLKTGA